MIPKGNQRGGGRQLATHLLNQFDNENVEVLDLRGAVAQDLHGAFHEWFAQSMGTRCRKYLYSLSVNPDLAKYDLTREQYLDFIERTERSLKLVGQPRAVVFHTKNGRQHCHTVWSRIDSAAGKAVHMDHDRFKLRAVAQEFARDHGLPLPPGMQKDGQSNKDRESSHREKQQQERTGISKEQRMATITAIWHEHKNPRAFVKALEEKGYDLARGDSGRYVVLDHAGEVHSLYRQIDGVRAKEIKDFLGASHPLEALRDVETVRKAQARQEPPKKDEPTTYDARREKIARINQERRDRLETERAGMEQRIEAERKSLLDLHAAENKGILAARAEKQPRGMLAFLARITGIQAFIAARQDAAREKSHKAQLEALDRRHGRERLEMDRKYAALDAIEARERQSLRIALKRYQLQKHLKPEFDRAAQGIDIRKGEGDSRAKGKAVRDFKAALEGKPPLTKGDLQAAFERAKGAKHPIEKPAPEPVSDPDKLERARKKQDDLEKHTRDTPGPERDRER